MKDGRILAVGKTAELAKTYADTKAFSARGHVVTPGFVDCHLHSSFQLSRGLADEANAQSFLFDRMYPYEAALDADDVRVSATLAATELLKHGVTCFIDPGNYHPESSVEGVMATGIRMIVSRSSFDLTKSVLGLLPERMIENTATALERAEAVLEILRAESPQFEVERQLTSKAMSALHEQRLLRLIGGAGQRRFHFLDHEYAALVVEDAGVLRQTEGGTVKRARLVRLLGVVDELVAEGDLGAGNLLAIGQLVLAGAHVDGRHKHLVLALGGPPATGAHAVVRLRVGESAVERVEHGLDVVLDGHLILQWRG